MPNKKKGTNKDGLPITEKDIEVAKTMTLKNDFYNDVLSAVNMVKGGEGMGGRWEKEWGAADIGKREQLGRKKQAARLSMESWLGYQGPQDFYYYKKGFPIKTYQNRAASKLLDLFISHLHESKERSEDGKGDPTYIAIMNDAVPEEGLTLVDETMPSGLKITKKNAAKMKDLFEWIHDPNNRGKLILQMKNAKTTWGWCENRYETYDNKCLGGGRRKSRRKSKRRKSRKKKRRRKSKKKKRRRKRKRTKKRRRKRRR